MAPRWSGWAVTNASVAVIMAASPLFMSAAPRPNSNPSRITGSKGSVCHSSSGPVGTTSVCPARQSTGPSSLPRRAQKLSTLPKRSLSILNPSASSLAIITAWQPPSSGLTEGRRMRSRVSSSVAVIGGWSSLVQ